jgi:prephenate dehydratase
MATKKSKKTEAATVPVEQVQELAEQAQQPQQPAENTQGQVQVNVDYLRTTKVHIAMPCYGGMLT